MTKYLLTLIIALLAISCSSTNVSSRDKTYKNVGIHTINGDTVTVYFNKVTSFKYTVHRQEGFANKTQILSGNRQIPKEALIYKVPFIFPDKGKYYLSFKLPDGSKKDTVFKK